MTRLTVLLALMVSAALLAPAVAVENGVSDTEVLVGEVNPYTGPPALGGIAHTAGMKIAISEANSGGGVSGRKIRLIAEDDGYVTSRTL